MKRCPQCEFIYEDDQSMCDMDGVLLVFDSRTLPNLHALATVPAVPRAAAPKPRSSCLRNPDSQSCSRHGLLRFDPPAQLHATCSTEQSERGASHDPYTRTDGRTYAVNRGNQTRRGRGTRQKTGDENDVHQTSN